jgi:hypothetical protein
MNVTFHELAAIAIAQETAAGIQARPGRHVRWTWAGAVALGVLSHGVLDAIPHYYPLPSPVDAVLSIARVAGWCWLVPRWMRVPLLLVCLGALLPDIVDLLPGDLRRLYGVHLPVWPRVFPWHWPAGSGSHRGRLVGPYWFVSLVNHLIVLAFCAASIVRTRHLLRRGAGPPGVRPAPATPDPARTAAPLR